MRAAINPVLHSLAATATANSKILVRYEDDGLRKCFCHANQADIGEAHWNVGIESVVKLIEKNCGLSEPPN